MLTLFRMTTGESWNGIMHDCMIQPPLCGINGAEDCGSQSIAMAYFCSFMVICSFLLMNLFIGVVLKNFSEEVEHESARAGEGAPLNRENIRPFLSAWKKINFKDNEPELMPVIRLPQLLNNVPSPLGLEESPLYGGAMTAFIDSLQLPDDQGYVHYIEVLCALAFRVYQQDNPLEDLIGISPKNEKLRLIHLQLIREYPLLSPNRRRLAFTASEALAATMVQARWRGFVGRRRLLREGESRGSVTHKALIKMMTKQKEAQAVLDSNARASAAVIVSADNQNQQPNQPIGGLAIPPPIVPSE